MGMSRMEIPFLISIIVVAHVSAVVDVEQELNKIEEHVKQMKLQPELIGGLLSQIDAHCPEKERPVNEKLLNDTRTCLERHFNQTQLFGEIREAIPAGQLDTVFRDMCLKWVEVKKCLKVYLDIIDECWQKGETVNKFFDEAVHFFCGDDNDGAKIALFLAEGGYNCLQQHGDEVKECVEEKQLFPEEIPDLDTPFKVPEKEDVCDAVKLLRDCTGLHLKKCDDPTPQNLVTSMIEEVAKKVECQLPPPVYLSSTRSSSVWTAGRSDISILSFTFLITIFMILPF